MATVKSMFPATGHWNGPFDQSNRDSVKTSDSTYKYFESRWQTPFLLCCYNLSFIWDLQCWIYNNWSCPLMPAHATQESHKEQKSG